MIEHADELSPARRKNVLEGSGLPGKLGGHRRSHVYGRLDCPGALRWIEKGHYVRHRVFFANESTAIAACYRPCARCLPAEYARWRPVWESW